MKAIVKIFYSLLGMLLLCYSQGVSQGGYSLSFDGIDDYVSVPHDATLTPSSITVEVWFYPTEISAQTIATIVEAIPLWELSSFPQILTNRFIPIKPLASLVRQVIRK